MLDPPPERRASQPDWRRALTAVRVFVTLGFLAALFFIFGLTPRRLASAIKDADGPELALAFAVLSVLLVLLSLKWYLIARGLDIRASFSSTTRLYLTSMVLNTVLPTAIGGDAYRVYFLSREGNTSLKRSFASVIIERATGYAGLLVLSAPAASFYFLGLLPGIAVSLAFLALFGLAYVLLRRLPVLNYGEDKSGLWHWGGLPSSASNLYGIAVLSVVQQSLWVSAAAILGLAYDVSVPWSYWVLTVTALTLLTVLPVSVGGLGLREVGYAALLAPLGVEASRAAAIGLAMGFAPSLLALVGLLPFLFMRLRPQPSPSLPASDTRTTTSEPTVTGVER